ncbi:hypothetical protein FYI09_10280 [Campylobacter coli]|nr:hypothetical protein [Campylobacter coli]ECO2084854.1 hypothetical protein [Campylobacter coli]ECQ0772896.1 hypothetical protein [Campylobacter coli]
MYEKTMKEVLSDIWNKKIRFNKKYFHFTYNKNKETFLVTMYLEYIIRDCDLFITEIRYEITNEKLGGCIVRHGQISKFKGIFWESELGGENGRTFVWKSLKADNKDSNDKELSLFGDEL